MSKPILLVDFDGVIHSYNSGWKGARVIPDPPVPGALQFLADAQKAFRVMIYSSRSRQWGGKWAMKQWLFANYMDLARNYESTPEWLCKTIRESTATVVCRPTQRPAVRSGAFADPWPEEARFAIKTLLRKIEFPTKKPAAFLTIDDRAFCFEGCWPDPAELLKFKPWNKRDI